MKVQHKVNEKTIIEVEGASPKEIFERLASLETVFSHSKCGICGSAIQHQARTAQQYTYYELQCLNADCRARFSFGQLRDNPGFLFPHKKNKDGSWKANGGWEKWSPNNQQPAQQSDKPASGQTVEDYENSPF